MIHLQRRYGKSGEFRSFHFLFWHVHFSCFRMRKDVRESASHCGNQFIPSVRQSFLKRERSIISADPIRLFPKVQEQCRLHEGQEDGDLYTAVLFQDHCSLDSLYIIHCWASVEIEHSRTSYVSTITILCLLICSVLPLWRIIDCC